MDKCPNCNTTYREILQTGFVGCEQCYQNIDELKNAVKSLYKGKRYRGKCPGGENGNI